MRFPLYLIFVANTVIALALWILGLIPVWIAVALIVAALIARIVDLDGD